MKKILLALSLLAASSLNAALTPSLVDVTGTGPYLWNYNVDLAQDQNANPGAVPGASTSVGVGVPSGAQADYFTIYDFTGFTGVHFEPSGWGFQSLTVGSTPSDVLPADSATTANLTWYRTGVIVSGPAALGTFSAESLYRTPRLDSYTSSGIKKSGLGSGSTVSSLGTVVVPGVSVPEPATTSLMGGALLGLGMLACRRR